MKKLIFTSFLFTIWILGTGMSSEANAQTAYGIAIVHYDTATRKVDGYSGTWLDYFAGLYYDPEVRGDLYRTDNPENSLDRGYAVGWADIFPAEVYLNTANFQEGKIYCTFSQHWVIAYHYFPASNLWLDPYRFSSLNNSAGGPWEGLEFSDFLVAPRRFFLGITQACIAIPEQPTPTPTPTATPLPTPSPTPCGQNLGESCLDEEMDITVIPTVIRPSGVTGGSNKAKVNVRITNGEGQPVANREVRLNLVLRQTQKNKGGHIDAQHIGNRPLGKLEKISGVTDSNGNFATFYSPSHISGVVGIDGTSLRSRDSSAAVFVILTNLTLMSPGENYHLIGQSVSHPQNHFGTPNSVAALRFIADDYKTQFYGDGPIPEADKIAFNDMSLIGGGKFDLARRWQPTGAHAEHREGINVDVRCCTNPGNIPRNRWEALNIIFRARGSNRTLDETNTAAPHWHLRFENYLAQENNTALMSQTRQNPDLSVQVNPATVTTHYFVEYVWWAVLDRESSQPEWSNWLTQIVEAKAQGSSNLLEKVKSLEKDIFSSSEYTARHRTNEEFITDVYEAHFMRQPTSEEITHWLTFIQNLPPSQPLQRKRARLIDEIQLAQEFEETILSLIDEVFPDELSQNL